MTDAGLGAALEAVAKGQGATLPDPDLKFQISNFKFLADHELRKFEMPSLQFEI